MNGVDISNYQKGLTIEQIKNSGLDFAIIKLTESTGYTDPSAFGFYLDAYNARFPLGCYCYSHATTPDEAAAEAENVVKVLNGFPMPCGVYLDVEEPDQLCLSHDQLKAVIDAWCGALMQEGYVPGVYGSEANLWAIVSPDELPEGTLVWVAKWSTTQPNTPCDLWQTSDSGNVDGYEGPVDTDVARSDRFKALADLGYGPTTWDKPKQETQQETGSTSVSGAFAVLAEFLQTEEFQNAFLTYVKRKGAD